MGLMYSATFTAVTVSAQQDFFEINAPSTAAVVVHGVVLGVAGGAADATDAQEELLSVLMKRGASVSGTGGTTATASQLHASAAFGGSVEANNTTKATTGTILTLHADGWNSRSPYMWLPTPEMRPVIPPSGRFTVELATTPADALAVNGTVYFETVG